MRKTLIFNFLFSCFICFSNEPYNLVLQDFHPSRDGKGSDVNLKFSKKSNFILSEFQGFSDVEKKETKLYNKNMFLLRKYDLYSSVISENERFVAGIDAIIKDKISIYEIGKELYCSIDIKNPAGISFSKDSSQFAILSDDGKNTIISVYDIKTISKIKEIIIQDRMPKKWKFDINIIFSPDNSGFFVYLLSLKYKDKYYGELLKIDNDGKNLTVISTFLIYGFIECSFTTDVKYGIFDGIIVSLETGDLIDTKTLTNIPNGKNIDYYKIICGNFTEDGKYARVIIRPFSEDKGKGFFCKYDFRNNKVLEKIPIDNEFIKIALSKNNDEYIYYNLFNVQFDKNEIKIWTNLIPAKKIELVSIKDGIINSLVDVENKINKISFSDINNKLYINYDKDANFMTILNPDGKIDKNFWFGKTIRKINEIDNGKYVAVGGRTNYIGFYDQKTMAENKSIAFGYLKNDYEIIYLDYFFSKDGNSLIALFDNNDIGIINTINSKKNIFPLSEGFTSSRRLSHLRLSPDDKFSCFLSYDEKKFGYNSQTIRLKKNNFKSLSISPYCDFKKIMQTDNRIHDIKFSDDEKKLYVLSLKQKDKNAFYGIEYYPSIMEFDLENKKYISEYTNKDETFPDPFNTFVGDLTILNSGESFLYGIKNAIYLQNKNGDKKTIYKENIANIINFQYDREKNLIYCALENGFITVIDLHSGEKFYSYQSFFNNEWAVFTDDGYFDSSRSFGNKIMIVRGTDVYSLDQFALFKNRPDIVYKKVGIGNEDLFSHYYNQYLKRIKKAGYDINNYTLDISAPKIELLEDSINDKYLKVKFRAYDELYTLKRYQIYINDIPIFGSYGKDINSKESTIEEMVELSYGQNKIEISCFNDKGIESFRTPIYKNYTKITKSDLYYIGFGVSKYKDSKLNLQYADKDAKDLGDVYSKMKEQYGNIYTKTYINEECTVENIKKAKDLLKNAKPDDTFVLFIAGHGIHDTDKEATYYFVTHETDITNLSQTAANFDIIEGIMQGIPPRNKLFLMDTCESGEIDDDIQAEYFTMADNRGIKSRVIETERALKKVDNTKKKTKRSYLYEKDRYIYNDLVRRSGAIVFSSCKGGEFSYESEKVGNGFFTSKIIESLKGQTSDTDKDGKISVDELKNYVIAEVPKLADGKQNPTVDRDNIYQKFGFQMTR